MFQKVILDIYQKIIQHIDIKKWIVGSCIVFIFAIFLSIIPIFNDFQKDVIRQFETQRRTLDENTILYDIEGKPFHVIRGIEDRNYVPLKKVSRNVQLAVVGIEDARFFQHVGFDIIRILAAIKTLLTPNASVQGASTITQQLVKLSLLSPERTFKRKIKEFFMSIVLELHYSKEQILEFYLNKVYFGHRNYGVENAAQNYFNTTSSKLTLAQASFIAGLIKKPEGYSPYQNLKKTRKRQLLVLRQLYKLNWISKEAYEKALHEKIYVYRKKAKQMNQAPYFTNHILLQLKKQYGDQRVFGGGLRVYTTLNQSYQKALEKVTINMMKKHHSFEQIAAVSMDPSTGFVKALVGGLDFEKSQFNRATQARRQPGSSFKPILYATALDAGIQPNDIFVDEEVEYIRHLEDKIEVYQPNNFNRKFSGQMTVAHALKISNNVISVKILQQIGIRKLQKTAQKFGLELPNGKGLCLALGCGETTLLNLVDAYTVFATKGTRQDPVFILKVTDSQGNVLEEFVPFKGNVVLSENHAYQMRRMLQNVVESGTARRAKINIPSGGKTGTTNDFRDAWYIGFTSDLVTGFWIGNDDNSPMKGEVGGKVPATLWKKYMTSLPKNNLSKQFAMQLDFEEHQICNVSGKIPTPWCPTTSWYPLKHNHAPNTICPIHTGPEIELKICKSSGKLASEACPVEFIERKIFYTGNEPKEIHGPQDNLQLDVDTQDSLTISTEKLNEENPISLSSKEFNEKKSIPTQNKMVHE